MVKLKDQNFGKKNYQFYITSGNGQITSFTKTCIKDNFESFPWSGIMNFLNHQKSKKCYQKNY